MFARLVTGVGIAAECGANPLKFVRGNRSPHAAAANEDSEISFLILNRLADFYSVIGIIVRPRTDMRAEIYDLVFRSKFLDHSLIERITTVVGADCNSHDSEKRSCVSQNVLDIEAKLAHYDIARGRSAKASEANYVALSAHVTVPTLANAGFNRKPCIDAGRQDFVAVLLGLLFEKFPARQGNDSRGDAFGLQFLASFQGKGDFRAGGNQ